MSNMFTELTDKEIEFLDEFLLYRSDDEINEDNKDEGILDVSELDGFFSAIVSGPAVIPPSQWLPVIWGENEPEWESEKDFETVFNLMMRHMNTIAATLMEQPQHFEPLFLEREVGGKTFPVVDEWCEGYSRGVELSLEQWNVEGQNMKILLAPILAFTEATNWAAHEFETKEETENIRKAITPNVREIHAYWLARRNEASPVSQPFRHETPRVGRNDPCPCGSGKKYKKCCYTEGLSTPHLL